MQRVNFDVFSEVLHYGNRQDRELDSAADSWYSWDAEETKPGEAIIKVYGDNVKEEQYYITWTEIDPEC